MLFIYFNPLTIFIVISVLLDLTVASTATLTLEMNCPIGAITMAVFPDVNHLKTRLLPVLEKSSTEEEADRIVNYYTELIKQNATFSSCIFLKRGLDVLCPPGTEDENPPAQWTWFYTATVNGVRGQPISVDTQDIGNDLSYCYASLSIGAVVGVAVAVGGAILGAFVVVGSFMVVNQRKQQLDLVNVVTKVKINSEQVVQGAKQNTNIQVVHDGVYYEINPEVKQKVENGIRNVQPH